MNLKTLEDGKHVSICFIAPTASPLLFKTKPKNVIGPDIDLVNLAEVLSKKEYKINFITFTPGKSTKLEIDNISIIKMFNPNSKMNIISKIIKVWKALNEADSDIYFHYGEFMGLTSIFTIMKKKKSVYRIGSDYFVNKKVVNKENREFSSSKFSLRSFGNWIDIKFADAICVQTRYQYNQLKKNYKKKGIIIKNHVKIKNSVKKEEEEFIVLWIGSIAEVKQPLLFLKLAKSLPQLNFWMIGGYVGELDESFVDYSNSLKNFTFFGAVNPSEIDKYFKKASVLINTSIFEGFPNTFIEAWLNKIPVISLNSDPDGIIAKKKMGFHSKSFYQLKKDLLILVENKHLRNEMGNNGRIYIKNEHDIQIISKKYQDLFKKILGFEN